MTSSDEGTPELAATRPIFPELAEVVAKRRAPSAGDERQTADESTPLLPSRRNFRVFAIFRSTGRISATPARSPDVPSGLETAHAQPFEKQSLFTETLPKQDARDPARYRLTPATAIFRSLLEFLSGASRSLYTTATASVSARRLMTVALVKRPVVGFRCAAEFQAARCLPPQQAVEDEPIELILNDGP
jgi:hypothetical protein